MIAKTITYTDYDGVERTEKFYFNLNKAELAEMELSYDGGFSKMAQRLVDEQDFPRLVKLFKEIILRSYGVKSDDGKKFKKSHELSVEFSQTEAYSELFMELATNENAAREFIDGVVPAINKPAAIPAK